MPIPVVYIYELTISGTGEPAVFTWPNVCRKYIRDLYTVNGELHLPPPGRMVLARRKVNPKAGGPRVVDYLSVEEFLAG